MRHPVYVVLDGIRSLHNVGAIFRTADGAGVKKIFLCGTMGHPPRKEISKTALGAELSVPWEYCSDIVACLQKLKADGVRLVALEKTPDATDYRAYRVKGPTALILGHEKTGVSPAVTRLIDDTIAIPMLGKKESLNVAVAFGIAVYALTAA